jgi:hypothetical protein
VRRLRDGTIIRESFGPATNEGNPN